MQGIKLIEGDSYKVIAALVAGGVKVASVVTDPPYGLTSIVERFGKNDAKAAKFGKDGAFARTSAAFMGQTWDANGVEVDPGFWTLVYDVLLPGGFVVAFSSPRTYHRMATAIEAAGFITHPMIGWAYASGLPKGHHPHVEGFEGHRHGAQARKPALEPIYVGQKPYSEKTCKANLLKHGVGPVDIDGCRTESGGYPSNLITDGNVFPPRIGQFFERYVCERCQDQGFVAGGDPGSGFWQETCPVCDGLGGWNPFDGEPLIFNKKADKNDRAGSSHATVKPIALMQSLVRHVTPPGMTVLDPFAGSGTTGIAAAREGRPAILIEAEPAYAMDIRSRLLRPTDAGESYLRALGMMG